MMWRAGQIITVAGLTEGLPTTIHKTTAQTVTNSTALVDDTQLAAEVDANSVYVVTLVLMVDGPTAGDIRVSWSTPAGALTGSRLVVGAAVGTSSADATQVRATRHNWPTEVGYGVETLDARISERCVLTTGATAGTLQLRWAQQTANATPTRVITGSYMTIRKVLIRKVLT